MDRLLPSLSKWHLSSDISNKKSSYYAEIGKKSIPDRGTEVWKGQGRASIVIPGNNQTVFMEHCY